MRKIAVVLAAVAIAGCGVSKEKYSAKDAEALKYQQALADETNKTADLQKKVAELEKSTVALEQKLNATQADLAAARGEAAAATARSAQFEQLSTALSRQITDGQVEISELRGRMTVKLKDKILFASGSAALGKEGRVALDAVADAFKGLQGKNVIVAGYTDDERLAKVSAFKDNWELSTARAAAVVRYLQGKGVDPKILGAAGFSEFRPVAPNDSPANKSLNRRIEIALTAADYQPTEVAAPPK